MLNELPSIYCPLNFGIELKIETEIQGRVIATSKD